MLLLYHLRDIAGVRTPPGAGECWRSAPPDRPACSAGGAGAPIRSACLHLDVSRFCCAPEHLSTHTSLRQDIPPTFPSVTLRQTPSPPLSSTFAIRQGLSHILLALQGDNAD